MVEDVTVEDCEPRPTWWPFSQPLARVTDGVRGSALAANHRRRAVDAMPSEEVLNAMTEPRILAVGRLQSTLDVLVEEWERYGRNVIASNSKDRIEEIVATDSIDFVIIGGGLPDGERDEMVEYVAAIAPGLEVHPIPREEAQGAYSFIPFLNNLAIMFKVRAAKDQ